MVRAVTPIPFVKARFFDRCGKPLAGGQIYTYEANTTTPKVTYKDPYGLTPNTNPIILDAAGEADIYLDGTYRIRITDRNDVLINDVAKIGSWFSDNLQDSLDNVSSAMGEALKPTLQNLNDTVDAAQVEINRRMFLLDAAIAAAAAAGAGANGWTATLIDAEGGLNQRQINNGLNTIAELTALTNPVHGQRVYVKGYYAATNLALAQPYMGGGEFIYDSTKISENDGVINFNGWVRQNITEVTPQMAGAKSDGITDDRLACEKSIIAANKLNVKWVLPKYSTCLLNSHATINPYSAIILPILNNQTYVIDGTLKVGSFFDDKDFFVFTDINAPSKSKFTWIDNVKFFGVGTIDFSEAGSRKTTYKNRQGIYSACTKNTFVSGITFKNGDLPNCITTPLGGESFEIENCKFINLMQNGANDDHSTIYGTCLATKIRNCEFTMASTNGKLNACAVELHNSNSYFIDSTVMGYRTTHIIAVITVEEPNVSNIRISGLTCAIHRSFSVLDIWTGATLINALIYGNSVTVLPFPAQDEIVAAGISGTQYGASAMVYVTNDSRIGFDGIQGNCFSVRYFNNNYANGAGQNLPSEYKSLLYIYKANSLGIEIYDNKVFVPNIVKMSDGARANKTLLNIDQLKIYDNDYDVGELNKQLLVDIECNSIQSSVLDFKFNTPITLQTLANIYINDTATSARNVFKVHPENSDGIDTCFNTASDLLNLPTNKVSYPKTVGVYFGASTVTTADFYQNNIKTAKVINRLNLPDDVTIGDFLANSAKTKLTAICINPNAKYGTYDARLLLSNY